VDQSAASAAARGSTIAPDASRGKRVDAALERGAFVIFPTPQRPVRGRPGYYRASMRHGVATVHSGERITLGIIFHDASSPQDSISPQ